MSGDPLSTSGHREFVLPPVTRPACRVLLIDQEAFVRTRLEAILRALAYEVVLADTGAEALGLLESTPCDILVSDAPPANENTGQLLCRQWRLRNAGRYLYILMLTPREACWDPSAQLTAGADTYLPRGAGLERILAQLEIGRRITYRSTKSAPMDAAPYFVPMIDAPSGAYSLLYLEEHLGRELARSLRSGHYLSTLTCRFGTCLDFDKSFVEITKALLRRSDWVARAADSCFLIALPETATAGAHCVARKLHAQCHDAGFDPDINVTVIDAAVDARGWDRLMALLRIASCSHPERHAERPS